MLEILELINLKYLYIVLTLGLIGIICVFRNFRLGTIASVTGIILTSMVWGGLKVFEYLKNSMKSEGIDYSVILQNIKAILIGFIIFLGITLIYYFIIFLKNGSKRRENKKRRKRRYF